MIRENAAIGPIYSMYKECLYADDFGMMIHHLPDNYANDPCTSFGKIKVNDFCKNITYENLRHI